MPRYVAYDWANDQHTLVTFDQLSSWGHCGSWTGFQVLFLFFFSFFYLLPLSLLRLTLFLRKFLKHHSGEGFMSRLPTLVVWIFRRTLVLISPRARYFRLLLLLLILFFGGGGGGGVSAFLFCVVPNVLFSRLPLRPSLSRCWWPSRCLTLWTRWARTAACWPCPPGQTPGSWWRSWRLSVWRRTVTEGKKNLTIPSPRLTAT